MTPPRVVPADAEQALRDAIRHHNTGSFAQAEAAYEHILALHPRHPHALYFLATICLQTGRMSEALVLLRRALEVRPGSPVILNALAVALDNTGDVAAAEAAAREALGLAPEYAEAWHNLGNALRRQGRRGEASAAYEQALRLRPELDDTLHALASCLFEHGQPERAADYYRRLVDRWPDNPIAHSDFLLALWHDPRQSPRAVYEESRRWAARHAEPLRRFWRPHDNDRDPERRLRVGYVSPDFRDHAIGRLLRPVLAHHHREAFEVFCYSDVEARDGLTARLRALADVWRDTAQLSDEELAEQVRSDRIDILVDCCGHFAGNRLLAFALRPAPVQVSHFGYCGTTGMAAIDYRVTDAWSDPPGMTEAYHTEKLVRLEGCCCWCYAPDGPGPDVGPPPALSAGHVTFGSLNRPAKLNDPVVQTWARVLHAVPRSRLLLLGSGPGDADVSARFAPHGIEADRIEVAARQPRPLYLALHHRIDVALDPFPFNGDNTLCDALWMGVPSVALAGDGFASRRGRQPPQQRGSARAGCGHARPIRGRGRRRGSGPAAAGGPARRLSRPPHAIPPVRRPRLHASPGGGLPPDVADQARQALSPSRRPDSARTRCTPSRAGA